MSFQYLSFQRSPPALLQYGQQLHISPLITNDLREAMYVPEGGKCLAIQVAWARANELGHWTVVQREEEIPWSGESSAWQKVEVNAPSRREMVEAVEANESNEPNGKGSLDSVRLAMWVQSPTRRARPGGKLTAPSYARPLRPAKKLKTRVEQGPSADELLEDLAISPCEAALRALRDGQDVFLPVLTPPIALSAAKDPSSSSSHQTQKLTEIARLWLLPSGRNYAVLDADGPAPTQQYIEIREELGYQLDKHVWDASLALMATFCLKPLESLNGQARSGQCQEGLRPHDLFISSRGCVSVELGTGTGLLSLWLEKLWKPTTLALGSSSGGQRNNDSFKRRMFLTDLDGSLELAKSNALLSEDRSNHHLAFAGKETSVGVLSPAILGLDCFSTGLPTDLKEAILSWPGDEDESWGPDYSSCSPHLVVLVSDCSYNPDAYPALAATIKRLLMISEPKTYESTPEDEHAAPRKRCDERQAMCLLAKKHRNPDEQSLWDALFKENLRVSLHQGWHDDYTNHASIAEGSNGINGDARYDGLEAKAIGKWGIYIILPPVQEESAFQ